MKTLFQFKSLAQLVFIALTLFSTSLFAANLTNAKKAGTIGEQANGYIGIVKSASEDVKELIASINKKRKNRYKQIAIKQKLSLSDVEKIGGKKAISKTIKGNYIKRAGRSWRIK
jgi:uncharacterized protein YdbL (DUF1318 family)